MPEMKSKIDKEEAGSKQCIIVPNMDSMPVIQMRTVDSNSPIEDPHGPLEQPFMTPKEETKQMLTSSTNGVKKPQNNTRLKFLHEGVGRMLCQTPVTRQFTQVPSLQSTLRDQKSKKKTHLASPAQQDPWTPPFQPKPRNPH